MVLRSMLVCAFATAFALGQPARGQPDAVARALEVEFLPDSFHCNPELLDPVRVKLDTFTREDVVTLLASDDPHALGVGIHLASRQRHLDLLVNNPQLADDARASLPFAMCAANSMRTPPSMKPTTVRGLYTTRIQFWFGRTGSTAEKQAALFPPGTDPWSYVRPWEQLVGISQSADQQTKNDLKNRIRSLDERTRWVVLTMCLPGPGKRNVFTEAEIRAEFNRLSPEMRQAILDKTAPLPPDNTYKHEGMRAHTYRIAEILLTDKPLPDPLENIPEPFREMFENERRMLEAERRRAEEAATPRRDQ